MVFGEKVKIVKNVQCKKHEKCVNDGYVAGCVGSYQDVWEGKAKETSGGLKKKDLIKNKRGRIVSKKRSMSAKKNKSIEKAGYKTKKGEFKLFEKK